MKKRFLALLCLVMALSLCFAVSVTAEEHEPITLRMSWWGGEDRAAATQAAVNAFMAKYPWITVETEYASFDGWQEKCATQLAGGTAPERLVISGIPIDRRFTADTQRPAAQPLLPDR